MANPFPQARSWLLARAPLWQSLADSLVQLRQRRQVSVDETLKALDSYRALARDLATARRFMPGTTMTRALESIYAGYHSIVERAPRLSRATLLRALRIEIPATMASLRTPLQWVVLLFGLSTAAGWWLIHTYPTLIGLVASEQMIDHVERGELWTDGLLNVTPSSVLSIRILSNNIVVSILAFCTGVFWGLGTFYMVALNGLMLGAAFAFTRQHGLDGRLFNFIVAHGTVELSIICIAGAAGMALGESLIRPSLPSRRESFELCARRLVKLLALCALLLIGCGLIEGFVSPDPAFPLISRVIIGVCYWGLMWSALTGRLFGARCSATPVAGA
jgi:uncharacterized membrane protein SpoIIM required for sporulation